LANYKFTNQKSLDRSEFVDVLRGIAIFGVLVIHSKNFAVMGLASQGYSETEFLSDLADFGLYGVELFFLISGYLMANLYPQDSDGRVWSRKEYFIKRLLRIWPLWLVFASLGFVVGVAGLENEFYNPWGKVFFDFQAGQTVLHQPAVAFLLTLTFLGFVSPLLWNVVPGGWSIQNEIFNYIVWGLLKGRSNLHFLALILSFGVVQTTSYLLVLDAFHPLEVLGRLNLFSSLCFFYLGTLLWMLTSNSQHGASSLSNRFSRRELYVSALILVLAVINPLTFGNTIGAFGFIAIALVATYVLLKLEWGRILIALGKRSYFMYFAHFVVLYTLTSPIWKLSAEFAPMPPLVFQAVLTAVFVLICIAISYPLAALSWRIFEKPILSIGSKER
jgi:peptidoglycan/LPS O-acetylase OafA/YrhL